MQRMHSMVQTLLPVVDTAFSKNALFLFWITFASPCLAAAPAADLKSISETPAWRALLHYFEQNESEVIGQDFFLAPDGNENPLHELEITLQELQKPTRVVGVLKQSPYCAFPARRVWLEKQGFVFPKLDCPDFDRFFINTSPKSLTYVYSSAYPNNPASMFGHTLIRINQGKQDPLLDYGLNYAAQVPDGEVGITYILKGLLGFYPGMVTLSPYYRKVLEYTESENRDLWEYDLNFTEEETRFFTHHLWEIRFLAEFRYTFMIQNCSYHMIRLLQVVRPEQPLKVGNFLYVLPGDTVRSLAEDYPEWVKSVRFRPSHYKVLHNRYRSLNALQREQFKKAFYQTSETNNLTDPYVLETLISYYDYIKIEQQDRVKKEVEDLLRTSRVARARLGGVTQFPEIVPTPNRTNRPDWAHKTRKLSFTSATGAGWGNEFGLKMRTSLHDLMDPDQGYEVSFGVSWLEAEAAYSTDRRALFIKQFRLGKVDSLQPIRDNQFPISWRIDGGWLPWNEPFHEHKNAFVTTGGVGLTLEAIEDYAWAGFFIGPSVYVQQNYLGARWLSLSAEFFSILRINERLKVSVKHTLETPNSFPYLAQRTGLETSWGFTKGWELRLKAGIVESSYLYQTQGSELEGAVSVFF